VKNHHWSQAFTEVALIQPLSTAAEKGVFPFKNSFNEHHDLALQVLEASLMLQYTWS